MILDDPKSETLWYFVNEVEELIQKLPLKFNNGNKDMEHLTFTDISEYSVISNMMGKKALKYKSMD